MRFQVDVTLDQPSCPIHSLSAVRLHVPNFYSRHFLRADQWITVAVSLSLIWFRAHRLLSIHWFQEISRKSWRFHTSLSVCPCTDCFWIQHLGRVVKKAYYAPPSPSRKTPVRRVVAGCFPRPPHWKKRKILGPSLDQRLVNQHRYQRNFLMRHRQKMVMQVMQKQAYEDMEFLQQQHIAMEWPMLERRFQAGLGSFTLTEEEKQ